MRWTLRIFTLAVLLIFLMIGGVPVGEVDRGSAQDQSPGTPPPPDPLDPIIDNGSLVQMGINPQGHLNVIGGTLSMPSSSTSYVGLRYIPTNGESTAPGCLCEGWGVANADLTTTTFAGYANIATDGGVHGLAVQPGTGEYGTGQLKGESEGTAFKSIVRTSNGRLEVTHDYHPSSSPNLYQVDVKIENIGGTSVGDLRYRRVMDWDIAPFTFSEFVEIHVGTATDLIRATTDGFDSANPLSILPPGVGFPPTTLTPGSADYFNGPADQGALFDFGFGSLDPGAFVTFTIYYGAAADRGKALAAIASVGAEVYSLGIPQDGVGNASVTGPHAFIFAFKGVGGIPVTGFLTPATATNPVGTPHTVTATLTLGESPAVGVTVNFTVTGANPTSGSCVTGGDGTCSFTYTGTNEGSDSIVATATVGESTFTSGASKEWTAPPDTTPPAIVPTVTPAPNAAGWNNTDVTVTWSVTDPESDIASSSGCDGITLTAETSGTTLTCSATNGAGLSDSVSVTVKIDKTAPTIAGSRSPVANAAGWNSTDITVTFACSDALSDIASCGPTPQVVAAEGTGQSITGTAVDQAGNSASAAVSGISIDKTPPVADGQSVTTLEDAAVDITLTGNDPGASPSGINLASFDVVTSTVQGSLTGAPPNLTYTPAPDFNGGDSFTFRVSDLAGNTSAPAAVSISVDPVNDPPVATDDEKNATEDTTLVFPASDLTANDSPGPANESGQTLTVTAVSSPSANGGTVSLAAGDVTYVPASNFNGPDSFTYTACDNGAPVLCGTGTVNVNVAAVDDPPFIVSVVCSPLTTVNEGDPITCTSTADDVDVPRSLTTHTVTPLPRGATFSPAPDEFTKQFSWTPDSSQAGIYILKFAVTGSPGDSQEVIITVNDTIVDSDGDGVPDAADNCPDVPNRDQADFDGDGIGNVCDETAMGEDPNDKPEINVSLPPPPSPAGYPEGGQINVEACTVLKKVDLNDDGIVDVTAYVKPNGFNVIARVETAAGEILADRILDGLAVSFPKDLVTVDGDPQVHCTTIPLTEWFTKLGSGPHVANFEYVNFAKDPDMQPDGSCLPGKVDDNGNPDCFLNVWQGETDLGTASFTIGGQCSGGGNALGTNCSAALEFRGILHTVNIGGGRSTKVPLPKVQIRVFDTNNADFLAVAGKKNPDGSLYGVIFEAAAGWVGTCTTDPSGVCYAGLPSTGEYLVIAKFYDKDNNKSVYTGRTRAPSDFSMDTNGDFIGDTESQFIQVFRQGVFQEWRGGRKVVVTGSLLEMIVPESAIWEGTQSIYPFIFTSDSDWTVDVCAEMPTGYSIVGVYDESGFLIADTQCLQTFVSNESKVVAFEVVETGSPEPTLDATLTITNPKGKVKVEKIKAKDIRKASFKAALAEAKAIKKSLKGKGSK